MSMWDAPIELANKVYTLAYIALVLGAILTAVSTMSLFWASAVRDKYADGQIQGAKRDAAQATEHAGVARAAAALATERGNALAVEAEQARTEQGRLQVDLEHEKTARAEFEAQFSWRVIDDAKRTTLVRELSVSPKTIVIEYAPGDQEATFLALQLIGIFKDAKWTVAPRATPSPPLVFGLIVPGPQSDASKHVIEAFAKVGIVPAIGDLPLPGFFMGDPAQSGLRPDCRLVVGAKPTPEIIRTLSRQQQP
jgi:hypothetical protein